MIRNTTVRWQPDLVNTKKSILPVCDLQSFYTNNLIVQNRGGYLKKFEVLQDYGLKYTTMWFCVQGLRRVPRFKTNITDLNICAVAFLVLARRTLSIGKGKYVYYKDEQIVLSLNKGQLLRYSSYVKARVCKLICIGFIAPKARMLTLSYMKMDVTGSGRCGLISCLCFCWFL